MCGRFVITSAPEALRRLFGYIDQPNFPPRYNIAPTQPVPVVIVENGARHFRLMRWGFIPAWVKDPRGFALLINARAETVAGQAGVQERDPAAALPDPGGRLLRMVAVGGAQAAVFHPCPRWPAVRLRRARGNLDRPERRGTRHRRDRHHGGQRRSGGAASPRARDHRARGFRPLAGLPR